MVKRDRMLGIEWENIIFLLIVGLLAGGLMWVWFDNNEPSVSSPRPIVENAKPELLFEFIPGPNGSECLLVTGDTIILECGK